MIQTNLPKLDMHCFVYFSSPSEFAFSLFLFLASLSTMMNPMAPAVAAMVRTSSCQWSPSLVETPKPALTPTLCTSLTRAKASALLVVYWLLTSDIT